MSEKISRRVFLKTTGFAALSVAAAGVLGGCDISPLPGSITVTAPSESSAYASLNSLVEIGLGSLYGQWTSNPVYESTSSDKQQSHNYFYTGLYINNGSTADVTLQAKEFTCALESGAGAGMTVRSLDNIKLNKDATQYEFTSTIKVPAGTSNFIVPVFIDIGSTSFSSLQGTRFTITLNHSGKKITFKYLNYSEEPTTNPNE